MPRPHKKSYQPPSLSTHDALRNLHLAVRVRSEQVKLRRLEWDTQTLALPHITPLPGDGALQVREPLTDEDMPPPRPPVQMPEFKPGMPYELYQILIDVYLSELRSERERDPYQKLASVSGQAAKDAKQEREDARLERLDARDRGKKNAKAT